MSGEQRQQESTAGPERPRLNAEEYRQLFEECHDAMVVTARDGTILEANHAASEMFDWPHDRFLGMDIHDVYANREDRARYQEQIEREGYVRDYEVVFVTRDGRRLDCLLTNVVRRSADGSVRGYQSIVRDVTEAKRLAAELVAIQDRKRRRIASGLHDGACQNLAVARMKLEHLRQADEEQRQPLLDVDGLIERTKATVLKIKKNDRRPGDSGRTRTSHA